MTNKKNQSKSICALVFFIDYSGACLVKPAHFSHPFIVIYFTHVS